MLKLLAFFLLIVSCSGYHFKKRINPWENLGIRTLSIPMFVNNSILPNVNGPFSSSFINLLKSFQGLIILPGENRNADAILIGVVESDENRNKVIKTDTYKFTTGELQQSLGARNPFYIPLTSKVSLKLRLVLIKNPSKNLIDLISSKEGKMVGNHPKIVFKKTFSLSESFVRQINPSLSPDQAGILNFTKNTYFVDNVLKKMAETAATKFNEEVLHAF